MRGIANPGLVATMGRLLVGPTVAVHFCVLDAYIFRHAVDVWSKHKISDFQGLLNAEWIIS